MFLQIIILFLFSIFITSVIENKLFSKIIAFILSIFISMEIFSIYIGGSLINYRFYVHANFNDMWAGKEQFGLQGLLAAFSTLIIYFAIKKLTEKLLLIKSKYKKYLSTSIIIILFAYMSFPTDSIFNNLYTIYKIQSVEDIGFNDALKNLGIPPNKYIKPEDLKAKSGKNIIIISMESIERGFLNKEFEKVTPNLQKFSNTFTYFNNMPNGPGSSWTSGSLYTFLLGVPDIMPNNLNNHKSNNDVLQGTYKSKLTGLGNVLKIAGYKSTFLIGDADFAGTRELVTSNHFKVIDGGDLGNKYTKAQWGLYDYDLFCEAKSIISKENNNKAPFALILSTISTHPPHGIYDKRMEGKLPKNLSQHEFTIATLDYLINDLFNYLKKNDLLENTAIYIFPDHLLMGLGSSQNIFDKLGNDRKLYMITNIDKSKFSKAPNKTIYQIDLPKLIIEGAEIETNATFLTDYIKEENKIDFIRKNMLNISKLNEASLLRIINNDKKPFKGDITISIEKKNSLSIKSKEGNITYDKLNLKKEVCKQIIFNKNLTIVKSGDIGFKSAFDNYNYIKPSYMAMIIQIKDSTIFTYLGNKNNIGLSVQGIEKIKITKNKIENLLESIDTFNELEHKKIKISINNVSKNLISVRSSGKHDFVKPTKVNYNGKDFRFSRGLNVVYNKNGIDQIESFDTFGSLEDANKLIILLKKLQKNNIEHVIFAHDSAENQLKHVKTELQSLGFNNLLSLGFRQPYIAYYNNGVLKEIKGDKTISTILPWHVKINN